VRGGRYLYAKGSCGSLADLRGGGQGGHSPPPSPKMPEVTRSPCQPKILVCSSTQNVSRAYLNNPSTAKCRQLLGDERPWTPLGTSVPRPPEFAPSKFIFWIRPCCGSRYRLMPPLRRRHNKTVQSNLAVYRLIFASHGNDSWGKFSVTPT